MAADPTEAERVRELQGQAAADYAQHHDPATAAAVREQQGWAQVHGNAAAGAERGQQ